MKADQLVATPEVDTFLLVAVAVPIRVFADCAVLAIIVVAAFDKSIFNDETAASDEGIFYGILAWKPDEEDSTDRNYSYQPQ